MTGADQNPYSGWQTNADEPEDAMRLAPGLINSLATLMLSLTAACGANVLTNDWTLDVRSGSDSAPAVGTDGTAYFGSRDRKFYALAPDGHKKWEFATDGPIVSSPALNSGATRETSGTSRTIHPSSVR